MRKIKEESINIFSESVKKINNSPFFAGLCMLMLNVGSKYVVIDLSENQKEFMKYSFFRQFLIFTIIFMGTKDVILSIIITASFVTLSNILLNEDSKYNILPVKYQKKILKEVDINNDGKVDEKEIERAIDLLQKAQKQKNRELQINAFNNVFT